MTVLAATKDQSVTHARAWVEAMLGFEVYTHLVLEALHASPYGEGHGRTHGGYFGLPWDEKREPQARVF